MDKVLFRLSIKIKNATIWLRPSGTRGQTEARKLVHFMNYLLHFPGEKFDNMNDSADKLQIYTVPC